MKEIVAWELKHHSDIERRTQSGGIDEEDSEASFVCSELGDGNLLRVELRVGGV